jgi:hypothetical protein
VSQRTSTFGAPTWSPGSDPLDSPAVPAWPTPRSPRTAAASCTSQPASPAAPAEPTYASTPPGSRHRRSLTHGNASAPPSDDQPITRPPNHERDTGPRKARPTRRHGADQPRATRKQPPGNITRYQYPAHTNYHAKPRLALRCYFPTSKDVEPLLVQRLTGPTVSRSRRSGSTISARLAIVGGVMCPSTTDSGSVR